MEVVKYFTWPSTAFHPGQLIAIYNFDLKVTTEEALQKEIIQLLCIEPMSHSTLNKALAEDVNRETGMEKVVESVASFKKPSSGLGKGVYELKEEFYDQYNVFFYHYTKEEQSKVCFIFFFSVLKPCDDPLALVALSFSGVV